MATLRIRSFNALRAKKFGYKLSLTDRLIMMRSPVHTHTELQFGSRFNHISFSATMKDRAKACRFKEITYSHPERWDTVEFELTDEVEALIFKRAQALVGKPYDLWGLLSFATPLRLIKPSKKGYWCTEVVASLIEPVTEVPIVPDEMHPTMFDSVSRWYFPQRKL